MWTPATRRQHSRAGLRYETDLTDAEWRLIAPLLPAPKRTGRPLSWPLREIVNAIFYVMRGGVAWRLLPSDLPPKSTAYRWFAAWRDGGVFEALNHALLMIDRERSGRPASPSACIIDSQSVKTNEAGGPRGYDAGKKIKPGALGHLPLKIRRRIAERITRREDAAFRRIRMVEHINITDTEDKKRVDQLHAFYDQVVSRGGEGVVVKLLD